MVGRNEQYGGYNNQQYGVDGGPAILVAASNASDRAKFLADYVADGTGDEEPINDALAESLANGGGEVKLSPGLFTLSNPIIWPLYTQFLGSGTGLYTGSAWQSGTVLLLANSSNCNMVEHNVDGTSTVSFGKMANMTLYGAKGGQSKGHGVVVRSRDDGVYAMDLDFERVFVHACKEHGFYLTGDYEHDIVTANDTTDVITIAGDFADAFPNGGSVDIEGSTANDGTHTISAASTYDSATDTTTITLTAADLTDSTGDGKILRTRALSGSNNMWAARIRNCLSETNDGCGIKLIGSQCNITDSYIAMNADHQLLLEMCQSCLVTGNQLRSPGGSGECNDLVEILKSAVIGFNNNMLYKYTTGATGINVLYGESTQFLTINGNNIRCTGGAISRGLYLNLCYDYTIGNNQFSFSKTGGGTAVTHAIRLQYASPGTITGNQFHVTSGCTGTYGMYLRDADGFLSDVSIHGNVFGGAGTWTNKLVYHDAAGAVVANGYNVGLFGNTGDDVETLTAASPTLRTTGSTQIDSTSNAVNGTLGSGSFVGQMKTIVMTNATNPSTVSVTNHVTSDPEVFTFDAVDETLVLVWTGTEWATLYATATT